MRNRIFIALSVICLLIAHAARAQLCQSGLASNACIGTTITWHISTAPVQVLIKNPYRAYLFLQNTGYTFVNSSTPTVNQNPVFCAFASNNQPQTASAAGSNVTVIQAGGVYEPTQIVAPQSSYRVPSGDISCVAPLGDVWLTVEQE